MAPKFFNRFTCFILTVATAGMAAGPGNSAPVPNAKGRVASAAARPRGPAPQLMQSDDVGEPTRSVVYKTVGDRKLELHIFEPAGFKPSDRRTCFVAIHGGGWVSGRPSQFYRFADHFAKLGCVGLSVQYRLVGKTNGVTVSDCVKDGRSAIRYLRQHAAELGIDPQKIVVTGGSAGGHVAAGTALCAGIDEAGDDLKISSVPDALVLYFPVIDTSKQGYGNAKCGEKWPELSPLLRVKPGLPPTLVLHGTADTVCPFPGAQAFAEAMRKAGNRCELIPHEGGRHGYLLFELELFNQAMGQTEAFLKSLKLLGTAG